MNDSLGQSGTVSSNRDILLFERLVAGDLQGLYRALAAPVADLPPDARALAASVYAKAGDEPWKADALVAAALGACGGDADLRAVVLDNLGLILVDSVGRLRSEAAVRQRVAELAACREFLARRLFSRLGRPDSEGLLAALRSQPGARLSGAYADLPAVAAGRELSPGLRTALGGLGHNLRLQMFEFQNSLAVHLGREDGGIPDAPDPLPRPESGLLDDAIRRAREQLAAEKKEAVDTYVRGRSQAAERLRGAFDTRLGPEPDSPASTLKSTFQAVVGPLLNRAILQDMKKFETGKLTQFDLDLKRGFKIVLAGVGEVSANPDEARDQFAKFVTRNPAATYAKLDLRTRRKAHLAMAIASQGTHNAVNFGFGVMLDPQGRNVAASFDGNNGERTFTMGFNAHGGLAILFRSKRNPTNMVANGEPVLCGPGSQIEENLDLLISPEEQERLAGVNFAAYDDGPVSQMVDRGQSVDKYKESKFVIPQEYRIRVDVGPTFVADLR